MLQKIEKILFYVFIFLIPFQVRATISWNGNEWNSVFLYLTDLLLVGFLFLGFINAKSKGLCFKKSDLFLFLFFFIALISVFVSSNKSVSIFHLIKLLEFIALYIYISSKIKNQKSEIKNVQPEAGSPLAENFKIETIFKIIVLSGVLQAILAIVQFYKQSSLGLKFIEAGSYTPGEAGVATFISGAEKVMRAYGSFPHPNVLSAFLLLAIFCFYALFLRNQGIGISGKGVGISRNRLTEVLIRLSVFLMCLLLIFALFLTFSRATIVVFVFVSFAFFLARFFQIRELYHTEERLAMGKRMMTLAIIFVIFSLVSTALVFPYFKTRFTKISINEEAIDLRFFYGKMAIEMIKEKPITGIGIGTFADFSRQFPAFLRAANKIYHSGGLTEKETPEWLYQPAHNIYLLIAAEIGIFGALIFVLFLLLKLFQNIGRIKPEKLSDLVGPMIFLFLGFLILGFNDHYFWTLQSGGIIFWISLALMENVNLKAQNENVKLKIP